MNKDNIVLFLLHLPPPVHGSSVVGKIIKDSKDINSTFECRYINLLLSRSIDETGNKSLLKVFRFTIVWFKLLKELIAHRPELCYLALTATGNAFYKDVLLILLLRMFNVKRVFHLHNKGIKQNSIRQLNSMLYRFVFHDASVILLSEKLYPDIAEYVPKKRTFISPNGIPKLPFPKKKIKATDEPIVILFLSNLIESKGVFILLQAMKLLKERDLAFRGIFVGGEGDISADLFHKEVIKLELQNHVKYLGKKYDKEKELVLNQADIFAFPTYYSKECFPLVLLEAIQHFLPVISTDEGGIPGIVEDGNTGFLVPRKEVVALADKLELLIRNPEQRRKMGENGRKRYLERFTLEKFENRMIEILAEVADNTCIVK